MAWWRHQMETFSALLAICAGNSPVPGEFPTQRPVTWSFDVYFDLRPNKWLSKQSWGWWFETLSCSLWRHRNGNMAVILCGLQCDEVSTEGGDPSIVSWFGHTRDDVLIWFLMSANQAIEQMVELSLISDAMTLVWNHCNEWKIQVRLETNLFWKHIYMQHLNEL